MTRPLLFLAVILAACFTLPIDEVLAQSSLGLGRSEQAIRPEGMFAGILFWIQQYQQAFYKSMTTALQAMKSDPAKLWLLVGLSFLYGIFHAAGPGHGKAVISSYMLANEVAAKRGILLSFASAMLQGVSAIVVIGAILLALRGSGIKTNDLAGFLEISSYFLVMLLGAYLLWTKVFRRGHHHHHHPDDHSHEHGHHDHEHDEGCGHLHAPDPKQLEGRFGINEAWTAILAVGLRPCSGAIIVLTFAFLNGLILGGILSTFAMSIGTGITVATLALLSVIAKNTAIRIAGMQDSVGTIHRAIEIIGAALVFLIGLLLFSAAISV
ncbi:MAG: nickel/cobalt transporter [Pseudomonadota bacterium]